MKIRGSASSVEVAALNLTSMIDCVFLLLIFFVSTLKAPKLEANIQAYLPKTPPTVKTAGTAPTVEPPKKDEVNTVQILLRRSGAEVIEVYFNGAPLTGGLPRLNAALASLRQFSKDATGAKTEIVLDADPLVPYRHVVTVLDLCAKHQFVNVSFAMPAKPMTGAP